MRFSELKGMEGIDKLTECIPHVDEIFSDEEFISTIKANDMSWIEAATIAYKTHNESVTAIMNVLGEKPETAIEILSATASIMAEIFQKEDIRAFFISQCRKMRSAISAMANTEDEQSAAS